MIYSKIETLNGVNLESPNFFIVEKCISCRFITTVIMITNLILFVVKYHGPRLVVNSNNGFKIKFSSLQIA